MKVWIVTQIEDDVYPTPEIMGVFDTEQAAKDYIKTKPYESDYLWDEWEVQCTQLLQQS